VETSNKCSGLLLPQRLGLGLHFVWKWASWQKISGDANAGGWSNAYRSYKYIKLYLKTRERKKNRVEVATTAPRIAVLYSR
jgi:hypothetical protein